MKTPAKKKADELKTPQSLIHVKHNMTLAQYKYWILFLHDVKRQILQGTQPDSRGYYYISMDEVNGLMGNKATQKKSIIFDDLKQLKDITVSYNILEKDGQRARVGHGFISEWSVSNSRIGYVLPRVFIEAMLDLDNTEIQSIFHLLNWEIFNSFSGKYEAIIYKLCKDYVGIGQTPYFTLEKFREYVGLQDDEYPAFKFLNHWVIQKPIKVINSSDLSDIEVDVKFERQARKVVGLQFFVKPKQSLLESPTSSPFMVFAAAKVPIPTSKQQEYLSQYTTSQIEIIITRANQYIQKLTDENKQVNFGGIYHTAFNEGWGLADFEADQAMQEAKQEQETAKKQQKDAKKQAKKEQAQNKKALSDAEKAKQEQCVQLFESLPIDEQEQILDKIEKKTPGFLLATFKKQRKAGEKPHRQPPHIFALVRMMEQKLD